MINDKYLLWCEKATKDPDLVDELKQMAGNNELISDAFYKELEFGTAGLRGVIGAGTNRMNIYTVGQASQGLADYVNSVTKNGTIVIGYDSRIKSDVFAKASAEIFAANGLKVYMYSELMPTPMVSFAIRRLKCDAGIMVTASHNPAKYNGYKAYGPDGTQLSPEAADYVLSIMQSVDAFTGVKTTDFDLALKEGKIEYIGEDIINEYLEAVKTQQIEPKLDMSNLRVIYSPLNGTGNKPVREILKRIGVSNVTVVPEQELPDGNFPTAPYPNPEIRQAFDCALKLAETVPADLLLATDPDCDRVGIAVRQNGSYELLTGNDVGAIMLYYILSRKTAGGKLPQNPIAVKTIVTSEICQKICDDFGCSLINVLTGFKFIGEQISILEAKNEEERFILCYEESYGYLAGAHCRDKDAVVASMLICEMAAFYKNEGKTLIDVLNEIYDKYGYYYCAQKSFTCEGQSGMARIKGIMEDLRANPPKIFNSSKIIKINDYKTSISHNCVNNEQTKIDLPSSDVLSYFLEDGCSFIVRPSGTEPKIKLYIGAVGNSHKQAVEKRSELTEAGTKLLGF